MMKDGKNLKGGFTIVELLVVIAIIAILAGAITMGVNSMFYKSRLSRAKAMRNMLQSGIETYYARRGDWPDVIKSKVNSTSDEIFLTPRETDECFRQIVRASVGPNANPVLDPSGLYVCKNAPEHSCPDIHKSWDAARREMVISESGTDRDYKCNGKCPYGRDFSEATKKGAKGKITIPQMSFGYTGPNTGKFCRFRLYYYPKSDTIRGLLQRANEHYCRKHQNGDIDD